MSSAVESRSTWTVPDDHVVVLFGATGDLAKRKLIPGLFRLGRVGLLPRKVRILGTSPVEMDEQGFRDHVRDSLLSFAHPTPTDHQIEQFLEVVSYVVSTSDDMSPLVAAVNAASKELGGRPRLLAGPAHAEQEQVDRDPVQLRRPGAGRGLEGDVAEGLRKG